jgi:hypothetical protein
MKSFYEFYQILENLNNLVLIDLEPYKKEALSKAKELLDFALDRKEKLGNFKLDINLVKNGLKDFPMLNLLLNSLNKNFIDHSLLNKVYNYFVEVRNQQKKESDESKGANPQDITKMNERHREQWNLVYNAYRHLNDYYDSKKVEDVSEKEYYDLANNSLEETNKNMEELKSKIESAISMFDWNGSKIKITPIMPESSEDAVPVANSAYIIVGKDGFFSYFVSEEKGFVDDIIEGGEDDQEFFANEGEKQDYFNLIDYLQNPNKKEKILTLFTARPAKDREFYSKASYLPANIFLSNSFSHVDGLAGDLQGERDVYKVRINSKYLIKTLDGPVKYYQVKKDAPVEYIGIY